jgi:hypothetical protein
VFRKMQSRVSTTAVESPLNQYSLLSVEEVPKDNEEVDDVAEEIHVIKPTTRSEGTRTRRKHANTNSEVGTQTQKDQLRSRDKSSSKSILVPRPKLGRPSQWPWVRLLICVGIPTQRLGRTAYAISP